MSKKFKLSQLNKQLSQSEKKEQPVKIVHKAKKASDEASPPRGERSDFLKVTITLPGETLSALKSLGIERKLQGMRDTDVSSLIREALQTFLKSEG